MHVTAGVGCIAAEVLSACKAEEGEMTKLSYQGQKGGRDRKRPVVVRVRHSEDQQNFQDFSCSLSYPWLTFLQLTPYTF